VDIARFMQRISKTQHKSVQLPSRTEVEEIIEMLKAGKSHLRDGVDEMFM